MGSSGNVIYAALWSRCYSDLNKLVIVHRPFTAKYHAFSWHNITRCEIAKRFSRNVWGILKYQWGTPGGLIISEHLLASFVKRNTHSENLSNYYLLCTKSKQILNHTEKRPVWKRHHISLNTRGVFSLRNMYHSNLRYYYTVKLNLPFSWKRNRECPSQLFG